MTDEMPVDPILVSAFDEPKRRRGRPTKAEVAAREASIAQLAAAARVDRIAPLPSAAARVETRAPVRERKRKMGQGNDRFALPDTVKAPPGMAYEWKRETLMGMSDPSYNVALRENGWEPVEAARHKEFMPEGYTGPIRRDGLILMERPIELTEEARAEDNWMAQSEIQGKMAALGAAPPGTAPRVDAQQRSTAKVTREWSTPGGMVVP